LAMMSVARMAVFPMQDILGLGEEARMNHPASNHGNWTWRFAAHHLTPSLSVQLSEMTEIYGRAVP
jgi:4-alpha-glucanotransferase